MSDIKLVCTTFIQLAITGLCSLFLVACGGGGGGSSQPAVTTTSLAASSMVAISSPPSSSSSSSSLASSAGSSVLAGRATADRPDRYVDKYQVHVIYAVPSDREDQQRDVKKTFDQSLGAANTFFAKTTNQKIRFDETEDGSLDVSYLPLQNSDNFYASKLAFAREAIQSDVRMAGFNDARKLYLVYYEGTNDATCGNAPSVGTGDGVTVIYLHGLSKTTYACDSNQFATDENGAGYLEFAALHELVHSLSFVDNCAPHATAEGNHTDDDPTDLMYAGSLPWHPVTIDPGQDDYFGVNVPKACARNLMNSAFLEPQLGNETPINFPHN